MPKYTLAELSQKLGEPYDGDGSLLIESVGEITATKKGMLSFVANPKYVTKISECNASALIIPKDLETDFRPVIRSSNPYLTFTKALSLFYENNRPISGGVHPTCKVASDVQLGQDVTLMAHVIVEEGAVIGDRSVIFPGSYIGKQAVIGTEVTLYPHVSIGDGCRVGARSILHGGCRIGTGNFRSAAQAPVLLEEDIELGANVVISGTGEMPSKVGMGTKIDNLVQIGAGSTIGRHCIVIAQVTMAEQVSMGDHVVIAGQVVIDSQVSIGSQSRVGAKSVVDSDIPANSDYWGHPAQPMNREKRMKASLARLPRLFEKIQTMEERLKGDR
ncbi:UDP-3-O-(3-hydroxymyristoyl)glucosamine N-acyltransferase [bacterium]|nr:UDP-3-O-(3-hydroxymyristoyl)glucosamine N-acyltransferase [bacterium]